MERHDAAQSGVVTGCGRNGDRDKTAKLQAYVGREAKAGCDGCRIPELCCGVRVLSARLSRCGMQMQMGM
jgi:hypothetical protein